ncbi:MAG TPA: IS630 family transposase [Longimicrobium sp.]
MVGAATAFGEDPVRLFVQDESRLGLHEDVRRRLTARGTKPVQSMLPRYEYFWLYAAVEPATGESLVLEMPALDAHCFQAFLDEFAATYPETLNVLVLDGAGAHTAGKLKVPENVLPVFLPPYSPELNPVERLWQDLKKRMGSALHDTLAAQKARAAQLLCEYTQPQLASLCSFASVFAPAF